VIALRPVTLADARALGYLSVVTWRQAYRGLVPDEALEALSIDQRSAGFEEMLAGSELNGCRGWLAHMAGAPIGFVLCGPARDLPDCPGAGEVYAVYVLKPYWGTGTGRELLAQAVQHLDGLGCPQIVLWVLEANARARRFYERGGFSPDGARKPDPWGGQSLDELRYRRRKDAPPERGC
jgi:GNAT superfamily N-acetyltransferase